MPARVVMQDESVRRRFQEKIDAKVNQERQAKLGRIDALLPSVLSGVIKPMASALDSYERVTSGIKGSIGESEVALKLRILLSDKWTLVNNVILEPEPGVLTQIDHIIIGPLGMYVVETKAWAGAFKGYRDRWSRKEGRGWVDCDSPTRQNAYHVQAIRKWLSSLGGWLPSGDWIFPVVIFTRAEWIRAQQCSVPVANGVAEFIGYVNNQMGGTVLSEQQVSWIVQQLISTPSGDRVVARPTPQSPFGPQIAASVSTPVKVLPGFEEKQTKNGRRYAKITGSREDAEHVLAHFSSRGVKAGEIQKGKFNQGSWFFYLD